MSNSDGRPPLGGLVNGGLHNFFGIGVEGGRGFVEQENLGIPEQSAGNRDSLLLPSRQLRSLASDFSIKSSARRLGTGSKGD